MEKNARGQVVSMKEDSMSKVYLAGQITGLTYDDANDWREYVIPKLKSAGLTPLNPLRAKEFLRKFGELRQQYHEASPLSTRKGIVTRDRDDVANCDIVLMNLKGMDRVSIGCMVEVGWADAHRKPIVMVLDEDLGPYDHEFIKEICGYIVYDLDEALDIVYAIAGVEPEKYVYTPLRSIPKTYLAPVGTDTEVPVGPYDC